MVAAIKVEESYLPPFVKMDEILTDGNVRPMDEKHVKELANSIKNSTLLERPTLQKVGENQYKIVSGFHRVAAMKLLKWENVPVQLAGERIGEHARITANLIKLDMPPMDIARNFVAICTVDDQIDGEKVKSLAKQLGRSESFVTSYIKLKTHLVGEFQDLLANPKSGFTLAHGLAAATAEKASQPKLFEVWKFAPGQSAETMKVWAKNPVKAAEAVGMTAKESSSVSSGKAKVTREKPYHAGNELQKFIGKLEKSYDKELVTDAAKAMIPFVEAICAKVTGEGLDFDAVIQKLTEALS